MKSFFEYLCIDPSISLEHTKYFADASPGKTVVLYVV